MRRFASLLAVNAAILLIGSDPARAQFGRGGGEWITAGADAQRSNWIRADAKISAASLGRGGFEPLWTANVGGAAGPDVVLLDRYIGYRGFRSLAFAGGPDGRVTAVDTDLNRIEWQKQIPFTRSASGCASASATLVARPGPADFPSATVQTFGLGGRGGPARSGVGEPYNGAVTLASANSMGRGFPGRGPNFRFRRLPSELFALTPDGMLHAMYVSNGEEPKPAVRFLPANASARGLIVIQKIGDDDSVDNTVYAVTDEACGAPAAVWSLDMKNGAVASWKPDAPIAGGSGIAIGPDGIVYAAIGAGTGEYAGKLVALEPKTLKVTNSFSAGEPLATSPVVFQLGKRTAITAAGASGKLYVLDAASLSGSPLATASISAPAHLALWQDRLGTTHILAASNKGIETLKITNPNGSPAIEAGWSLREPVTSVSVINDVVFAVKPGKPAVLRAFDAATGKLVWNSGQSISSEITGAVSGGGGQVFLTDRQGTLYAFGYPMEH